ncbi:MAG TPA: DUF5681 domain-containing protein [Methanosarcinales archaeon]|nr:DUF5681 domain-containing protein [Methanosarcinales archaeon]
MFQKGQINNPKGRPKGSKNKFSVAMLQKAFKKAAGQHEKQTILENLTLKAYSDPTLAIQLLKFLMPHLKQIEVISSDRHGWSDLSPQEILEKMSKSSAPLATEDE